MARTHGLVGILIALGLFGCGSDDEASFDPPPKTPPPPETKDALGTVSMAASIAHLDDGGSALREFQIPFDRLAASAVWPIAGDFDGDGFDTVSFYNLRSGELTLDREGTYTGLTTEQLAAAGTLELRYLPLAGDVDADGKDDYGTYDAVTGEVSIRTSKDGGELEPARRPAVSPCSATGTATATPRWPATGSKAVS